MFDEELIDFRLGRQISLLWIVANTSVSRSVLLFQSAGIASMPVAFFLLFSVSYFFFLCGACFMQRRIMYEMLDEGKDVSCWMSESGSLDGQLLHDSGIYRMGLNC